MRRLHQQGGGEGRVRQQAVAFSPQPVASSCSSTSTSCIRRADRFINPYPPAMFPPASFINPQHTHSNSPSAVFSSFAACSIRGVVSHIRRHLARALAQRVDIATVSSRSGRGLALCWEAFTTLGSLAEWRGACRYVCARVR